MSGRSFDERHASMCRQSAEHHTAQNEAVSAITKPTESVEAIKEIPLRAKQALDEWESVGLPPGGPDAEWVEIDLDQPAAHVLHDGDY